MQEYATIRNYTSQEPTFSLAKLGDSILCLYIATLATQDILHNAWMLDSPQKVDYYAWSGVWAKTALLSCPSSLSLSLSLSLSNTPTVKLHTTSKVANYPVALVPYSAKTF